MEEIKTIDSNDGGILATRSKEGGKEGGMKKIRNHFTDF